MASAVRLGRCGDVRARLLQVRGNQERTGSRPSCAVRQPLPCPTAPFRASRISGPRTRDSMVPKRSDCIVHGTLIAPTGCARGLGAFCSSRAALPQTVGLGSTAPRRPEGPGGMIPAAGYLLEQGRIVVRGPYHGSMGSRHRHGDEVALLVRTRERVCLNSGHDSEQASPGLSRTRLSCRVDPAGTAPASESAGETTSPSAAVDDFLAEGVTVGQPSLHQAFLRSRPSTESRCFGARVAIDTGDPPRDSQGARWLTSGV